jgi:DNA-binding NarL/FixJ family response regulator
VRASRAADQPPRRRGRLADVWTGAGADAECIEPGALAYLTKQDGPEHLIPAIRAAAQGRPYTAPRVRAPVTDDSSRPRLSAREMQVLRAWFLSASKDHVAAELHIAAKTVDTYIARVRAKYANVGRVARTESELVTRALDDGIITPAELNDQCGGGA